MANTMLIPRGYSGNGSLPWGVRCMDLVVNLQERQREKQIKYERKMLRELSLEKMKMRFQQFFGRDFIDIVEDGCIDVAIEAFLLGANYSKFGYYGESEEEVKLRCYLEEKHLIDTLFNFILYWEGAEKSEFYQEGLYSNCEGYIGAWWKDGFKIGEKRYKMKLH